MSIPNLENSKERKRSPELYNFHTFCEPGCPITLTGPFRDNIQVFLQQCAEPTDNKVGGMSIWCTSLVIENKDFNPKKENKDFVVPLYIIEEEVKKSVRPFCDQCRYKGWECDHMDSPRTYHLIIPEKDYQGPMLQKYLDLQSHLLHGLIHSNGFCHLVRINRREGKSKYLNGGNIMNLWDRFCKNLCIRKISVTDESVEGSMDLRLLYGVAFGHTWFGRWGYEFSPVKFNRMSKAAHADAIELLSGLKLDNIVQDFSTTEEGESMKKVVDYYKELSPGCLTKLRDLLRFLIDMNSCPCGQKKHSETATSASEQEKVKRDNTEKLCPRCKKEQSETNTSTSEQAKATLEYTDFTSFVRAKKKNRWPIERMEHAARVIVNVLKEKKANKLAGGGITRDAIVASAQEEVDDIDLIDYVLLTNYITVGKWNIHGAMNRDTFLFEYHINEAKGIDVNIRYLYQNVLLRYPLSELVVEAAKVILNSDSLEKQYTGN